MSSSPGTPSFRRRSQAQIQDLPCPDPPYPTPCGKGCPALPWSRGLGHRPEGRAKEAAALDP